MIPLTFAHGAIVVKSCKYGIYELLSAEDSKHKAVNWVMTALKNKVLKPTDTVYIVDALGHRKYSVGVLTLSDYAVRETPVRQLNLPFRL